MHLLINDLRPIQDYLQNISWLNPNENIAKIEKAGEGNMNFTVRVITNDRSFILKQARPYVEKYPQIPAPDMRAVIEGRFYQKIEQFDSIASLMPQLMRVDEANKILILEDLGQANDYTYLYQSDQAISAADIQSLVHYLAMLHQLAYEEIPPINFENRAMRQLNHEHIFIYPFLENNGIDLDAVTASLQQISMAYKVDIKLKNTIIELGHHYMADGHSLLHGDFYPGSWLHTAQGIKIIDPEFCFYGMPEFDLGVMIAHLMLAQQDEATIKMVYQCYGSIKNPQLLDQFTGVEIMRRLLGVAQLPLSLSLFDKEELLEQAYELIMG